MAAEKRPPSIISKNISEANILDPDFKSCSILVDPALVLGWFGAVFMAFGLRLTQCESICLIT